MHSGSNLLHEQGETVLREQYFYSITIEIYRNLIENQENEMKKENAKNFNELHDGIIYFHFVLWSRVHL